QHIRSGLRTLLYRLVQFNVQLGTSHLHAANAQLCEAHWICSEHDGTSAASEDHLPMEAIPLDCEEEFSSRPIQVHGCGRSLDISHSYPGHRDVGAWNKSLHAWNACHSRSHDGRNHRYQLI